MGIETPDLVVIGLYMAALIGIGFFSSKQIQSATDYALAGRGLKFPVLLGTLVGTVIGAAATMGAAGKAFDIGYMVLVACISYFIGYLILARLAPRLRSMNITSVPDVLHRRFGNRMRTVASFVILAAVVLMFGLQLTAFGVVASTLLGDVGVSYETAILVGVAVILAYTLVGGLLAVAITDLLQAVILIIGIGFLLPVILTIDIGGTALVWNALRNPPVNHDSTSNWLLYLAFIPTYIAVVVIDPTAWQRIAAAEKGRDVAPALYATAGIYVAWSILIVCLGILAFHLYPDLESGDAAIATLIFNHMPVVVKGLCLAAIMAAIMSTADTVLLIAGTTFSMDFVRGFKPQVSDNSLLIIGRVAITVVAIAGVWLALMRIELFTIAFLTYGLMVAGLFIPVMAALFAKKATAGAALSAAVSGIAAFSVLHVLNFAGYSTGIEPVLAAIGISAIAFVMITHLDGGRSEIKTPSFPDLSED